MEQLLETCQRALSLLPGKDENARIPKILIQNPSFKSLFDLIEKNLNTCGSVYAPEEKESSLPSPDKTFKAIHWNIERGKNLTKVIEALKTQPDMQDADFYFFTEVDWGMVRSDNRNVTAELGAALEAHAYYAPSYYNFTKGHGVERVFQGKNSLGLHGKSILSRYPLQNLRVVPMPNITDKLNSKESRLGQKRALLGDLRIGNKKLTLACAHLDAFSSPRSRARQLVEVAKACGENRHVLLAGDLNTNTIDSTRTSRMIPYLLYQLFFFRPTNMIRNHHPFPERHFERPLFGMLKKYGFEYENCNEMGAGTFDLFTDDHELGEMVRDQYPRWALKYINRLIRKAGGRVSLKLDWFAAKNLQCKLKKVVPLPKASGLSPSLRASDHHPIVVHFKI